MRQQTFFHTVHSGQVLEIQEIKWFWKIQQRLGQGMKSPKQNGKSPDQQHQVLVAQVPSCAGRKNEAGEDTDLLCLNRTKWSCPQARLSSWNRSCVLDAGRQDRCAEAARADIACVLIQGLGAALGRDSCWPGQGEGRTGRAESKESRPALVDQPPGLLSRKIHCKASCLKTRGREWLDLVSATKTKSQDQILRRQVDMCLAPLP